MADTPNEQGPASSGASSDLPAYLASAKPNGPEGRVSWYSSTAQTYAGIMLWFVFWQGAAATGGTPGGALSTGIAAPLIGLVIAGLLCHFLYFYVPGMLGMKTGMPLYVIGSSTYGTQGGMVVPGFIMGALQFGWLGVNAFAVAEILCKCFEIGLITEGEHAGKVLVPGPIHGVIAVLFAAGAAFMGLKGIQYVAKVATFLPVIPLITLVVLFAMTVGGLGKFDPEMVINPAATSTETKPDADKNDTAEAKDADEDSETNGDEAAVNGNGDENEVEPLTESTEPAADKATAQPEAATEEQSPLGFLGVVMVINTFVIGFFATAGCAGVDFGMGNRNAKDIQLGGLIGIAGSIVFAGGLAVLIVAGAYGSGLIPEGQAGVLNAIDIMKGGILDPGVANIIMILLAIAAFPAACFSAFIAANSFRTVMPQINPNLSVAVGALASIILAVMGWAGQVTIVFIIIGAAFGPVCGAFAADYLLSGMKWPGPRKGWNLAGWISLVAGFAVGAGNFVPAVGGVIPVPPLSAFVVGFVLYAVLAKAGLEGKVVSMPQRMDAEGAAS